MPCGPVFVDGCEHGMLELLRGQFPSELCGAGMLQLHGRHLSSELGSLVLRELRLGKIFDVERIGDIHVLLGMFCGALF